MIRRLKPPLDLTSEKWGIFRFKEIEVIAEHWDHRQPCLDIARPTQAGVNSRNLAPGSQAGSKCNHVASHGAAWSTVRLCARLAQNLAQRFFGICGCFINDCRSN